MQTVTNLNDLFSYSILPALFFLLLLIGLVVYRIYLFVKFRKPKSIPIITPNINDRNQIKINYLKQIDQLKKKVSSNEITNRNAYQELSKLIRNFIYEMTSIRVQNYTLEDIKGINMPILYQLVEEYYDPEFSKISKGNIISSIEKTRKVMESWN